MTKEELKEQDIRLNKLCFDYQEKDKTIKELEEKISVLLSCKNCPENKGSLLCQKEYEDKCLAQKIEFIKELQKENAELKEINTYTISQLNLDNGELIIELTKAKELLAKWVELFKPKGGNFPPTPIQVVTEQFLSEVEK
jgi:hypothetical protein